MTARSVIISSLGLKNIVLNKYQEDDDFTFVFCEAKFKMKNIFAEFISPIVSHLHQTDPTINTIDFCKINGMKPNDFNKLSKLLITPDTISHLQQISSGSSIEITSEEAIKLSLLSIILGNNELHQKLNELFPTKYSEENVNSYMKNIECLYEFSCFNETYDFSKVFSFIASHFYMVDKEEFLKASREIQYMIISHSDLQIESEESLFDIISQIIEMKKDDDKISDALFLEQIEFVCLSETKFLEFVSKFDFNEMNGQLWQNLCQCFFPHRVKKSQRKRMRHQQQKKRECITKSIIVGGNNNCYALGENSNNNGKNSFAIISPPVKSSIDPSSLLSYSIYDNHSVLVMRDGSLKGIGSNRDGPIGPFLNKYVASQFTDFWIKDSSGQQLAAVSAVCYKHGTLYMLSKNKANQRQLLLRDCDIKVKGPLFLDIGNHQPVSLFGGYSHSAAIGSEGEVIFINRYSVIKSPYSSIPAISLPDGEKASSVACGEYSVVVLSSNGRLFTSPITKGSKSLKFSEVSELSGHEIVCLSGTSQHFLAVSNDGRVFGRGSNKNGQLGLGEETESVSSFTEISSLFKYEITSAYAGDRHSLFVTSEGKILSCGNNEFGQLLLSSGPSEKIYLPTETTITKDAEFCIAGGYTSVVFIGSIPPNTPNMRIQNTSSISVGLNYIFGIQST